MESMSGGAGAREWWAPGAFAAHVAEYDRGLCKMLLGPRVTVAGSGPLDESLVRDTLHKCGIEVWSIESAVPDVLVLGHTGWEPEQLQHAVARHNFGTLKVYSQEMLLATLITGKDVFREHEPDDLEGFTPGHAGLEYLRVEMGFAWPTTKVRIAEVVVVDIDLGKSPDTGVLKAFSYRVGKNADTDQKARRRTLDRVFIARLVPGSHASVPYIAEWGDPSSKQRLRKMANCLASFTRSAKRRRDADLSLAIREWEADLSYLYHQYYLRGPRFEWPETTL